MRLKYYLRGLGIGIVVTAVVLAFTGNDKAEMTDAQIIERAKELGMQEAEKENGLLLDKSKEAEEVAEEVIKDVQEESVEDISEEIVTGEEVADALENVTEPETVADDTEEALETQQPEIENTDTAEETQEAVEQMVMITIQSGDSSVSVSKRVADAGLVESASAYDRFLCQNGYDKKLAVGNHEIPVGATEEEIAVILTTRKK